MKNKTKTLWIVLSIALLLTVSVGSTLAYLITSSEDVENTFTPSEVKCSIHEDPFDGAEKSNVTVTNDGDIDAYIRAKVVVTWKDKEGGNVYGGGAPIEQIKGKTVEGAGYEIEYGSGWTKGSDGFWYYNDSVAPNASTANLIVSCTPIDGRTPPGYGLNVEILAQAIQKDGGAVTVGTNGGWTIAQ